jgi:3-oxoacyl-(acyl-carrier-protein) synthase
LVLEEAVHATARGARRYARIAESALRSHQQDASRPETEAAVLDALRQGEAVQAILSGDDAPEGNSREAAWARAALGLVPQIVRPKPCAGNLFAAAAALQVALGAVLVERLGGAVLAECFGYGTELAAFRLEPA